MKKIIVMVLALVVLLSFAACDVLDSEGAAANDTTPEETFIQIKESPDKYTWYIKNYVGRNCASFGSVAYDDYPYRYDDYGEAEVKIIFIADDGSFVDPTNSNSLKNYIVTAQSVAPNTELKLVFQKYEDGSESDWNVEQQNIIEIELRVKRVSTSQDATEG